MCHCCIAAYFCIFISYRFYTALTSIVKIQYCFPYGLDGYLVSICLIVINIIFIKLVILPPSLPSYGSVLPFITYFPCSGPMSNTFAESASRFAFTVKSNNNNALFYSVLPGILVSLLHYIQKLRFWIRMISF